MSLRYPLFFNFSVREGLRLFIHGTGDLRQSQNTKHSLRDFCFIKITSSPDGGGARTPSWGLLRLGVNRPILFPFTCFLATGKKTGTWVMDSLSLAPHLFFSVLVALYPQAGLSQKPSGFPLFLY
jgi:hypothetical protein